VADWGSICCHAWRIEVKVAMSFCRDSGVAADAGVEDHGASDFVESIEGLGRFAAALVIKDALKMRDDGEGVIQLEDALLTLRRRERLGRGESHARWCRKGRRPSDGRGARAGPVDRWRLENCDILLRSLVAGADLRLEGAGVVARCVTAVDEMRFCSLAAKQIAIQDLR